MVIVDVFVVDNPDGEHDDFGTADAMLLVEYKYQMLHLISCRLPTNIKCPCGHFRNCYYAIGGVRGVRSDKTLQC